MAQLKLTWEEFVRSALEGIKEQHPKLDMNILPDDSSPTFVKDRHGQGEGSITELPDYVYIELNE